MLRGRCVGRAPPRPRARGKVEGRPLQLHLAGVRAWASTLRARGVRRSIRYALLLRRSPGIRPFNDPTRPAPHRSPLRSRRRSRRRKRETEPRRGTSYYDVRAARDGRCGLPSAEARPPARASWRKATREIRSYTYELGGRVPRSSYETVPRYAARYASRVPRRRRRRAPRRPPPRNGRADGARARECHMRHHAIIRVAIRTVGNHIEYATPFCISDGVHADPRTQSDRA